MDWGRAVLKEGSDVLSCAVPFIGEDAVGRKPFMPQPAHSVSRNFGNNGCT